LEEGDLILHAESFNAVECNQWARKPNKIYWGEHTDQKSEEKGSKKKKRLVPRLDVPLHMMSLGGCTVSLGRRMM
jgi:hypothetical protein